MNSLATLAQSAKNHVTLTFSQGGTEMKIDLRPLTASELEGISNLMKEVVPPMKEDGVTPDEENQDYVKRREAVTRVQRVASLDLSCRGGVEGEDMAAKQAWVRDNMPPAIVDAVVQHVLSLSRDSIVDRASFSTPAA